MSHSTTQLFTTQWRVRLSQYSQLIIGYSGGLDSTVLLHALNTILELKTKLIAVHINHGISPNANSWQQHCAQWCQQHNIAYIAKTVTFDSSSNIEEHARQARYEVFSSLFPKNACLLLGHHQDDQAETILLQLFLRYRHRWFSRNERIKPMAIRNNSQTIITLFAQQLEHYAKTHQLTWIEDESNQDTRYVRNYLRHEVMPTIAQKWPAAVENMSRSAMHCQQAKKEPLMHWQTPTILI